MRKGFALVRITFGFVWLIDAYFKWQPGFLDDFVSYVTGALENQPHLVQQWINLWIKVVGINPHFFAYFTALVETILAVGLIFGVYTRYLIYAGVLFSLVIWSTAEGFGGPYQAGSTDIGSAIIYVLVFICLLLGRSWEYYSFDSRKRK